MTLKPHSVYYRHKGREYSIEVYGENPQDVQERIRSAYHNGEACEVVARFNAPAWLGKMIGGK